MTHLSPTKASTSVKCSSVQSSTSTASNPSSVKTGSHEGKDWPNTTHGFSLPSLRTFTYPSVKPRIGIVNAGFRVDNGLEQLEQCLAFTYANNLSQYTWFTESNKLGNNKSGQVDEVI
jgi:hypothetical protein